MTPRPTFKHIGGSIVCRGRWMDDAEVQAQADLALAEHDDCLRKGDRLASRVARAIFLEITDALKAQAEWKRAGSAPREHRRAA